MEQNCGCKTVTYQKWAKEGIRRFGPSMLDWVFKCPRCGETFSGLDFTRMGFSADMAFTNCIGMFLRWRGCPTQLNNMDIPVKHGVRVKTEYGLTVEVMMFASEDEEKRHWENYPW